MTKFSIRKIDRNSEVDYKRWKHLFDCADGVTVFHDPDFLNYHGDKFNEHHLGIFKGNELFGFIPLAIVKENEITLAKSPYGASYGGFIFKSILNYTDSKEIVKMFVDYLEAMQVDQLIITPSLSMYYKNAYSDTFIFALMEQGAKIIASDITSVVYLNSKDIEHEVFISKVRNLERKAKKARKANIKIKYKSNVNDFWLLMDKTFSKHATNPTHKKNEYITLMEKVKNRVYCNLAYIDNAPVAGIGVFEINNENIMSFYLCHDHKYQKTQAMSCLIYETILKAKECNFKYFDLGTSSVNMVGRENIFKFKESLGAVGKFRLTYLKKFDDNI